MLAYVQAFINIALRRSGPEDLPDSRFLFGLTLAAFLVVQVPLILISDRQGAEIAGTVAVSLALLFAGFWLLLRLTGFRARYRRTVTAILGTSALLTVLSTPVNWWQQIALDSGTSDALPGTIIVAIMLWSISIDGHILARALSRPYVVGLLVAIGYFFLQTTILIELMPDLVGSRSG